MIEFEYPMPANGLGTDFTESQRPLNFAETYTNRFRNVTGGAERRPGMGRYGPAISGSPNLTRLHEWVGTDGTDVLMASDDSGNIWRYNVSASAWNSALTGKASVRMLSAQAEEYLIFVNGVDRNFYTIDGGQTFSELKALITQGKTAGGTNATTLVDGNITNWIGQTNVSDTSIVYNVNGSAYGIVTTIASAQLTITAIGSAANGAGRTNNGRNQQSGDSYQLIDYVNLNIIPSGLNGVSNVGIAGPGTTTTVIAVSGVNFSQPTVSNLINTLDSIRSGDIVYNATQGAIAIVGSVSANVNLNQAITGQASGDTINFFKSAMPIASWVHVHYGRAYYLDSRKQTRIVISAPDDPQDVTTYQNTLDSSSISFGTQQPAGDIMLCMASFQQYFVAAGLKNLYIYRGITPIANQSGQTTDFTPIAFYPNGVFSRFGLGTNGTDLLHVTLEGLQSINIGSISFTTVQNNVSVPIRQAIITLMQNTSSDDVQLSFYPRRSWLIMKIGSSAYILNTNPSYDETGQLKSIPSWHLFTGDWAQQNHYYTKRNGDLISCGAGGQVYYLDNGDTKDDGEPIPTDLVTAWLRLEEPQKTPRVKNGNYIRPIFESGANIGYNISVVAGWDGFSSDSITVSAQALGAGIVGQAVVGTTPIGAGTIVQNEKYPLQWRGEQARFEFTTNSSAAPDIITGFKIYGDIGGVR